MTIESLVLNCTKCVAVYATVCHHVTRRWLYRVAEYSKSLMAFRLINSQLPVQRSECTGILLLVAKGIGNHSAELIDL